METFESDAVEFGMSHSWSSRWDRDGRCFERVDKGPEVRRPDMDFGTPAGDLLIDPCIQDMILSIDDE